MKRSIMMTVAALLVVSTAVAPAVAFPVAPDTPVAQGDTQGMQEEEHAPADSDRSGAVGYGMAALAAALAVGLCALGTGYAQAKIGTAGGGALAERPELQGIMIILVAIPETAVILGFVIAISLLGKL